MIAKGSYSVLGEPVRRFVAKPLIVAVLVHALFGCCLHHADACAMRCESTLSAAAAHCHCDHDSDSNGPCDESGDESPDHGSQHEACNSDRCVSIRPEPTASPELLLDFGPLMTASSVAARAALSAITTVDPDQRPGVPPIAVHLLNQALLL